MGRMRGVLRALALLWCVASPAGAQTGAIVGRVVADSTHGRQVENAEVMVPAFTLSVRTNANGEFRLAGLPAGRQRVVVRLIGYHTVIDSIAVAVGVDVRHDFVLGERAVELDSMVALAKQPRQYISPGLNGFLERMNSHMGGYFVDDSTLRTKESDQLPDVLSSRLAGMRIYRSVGDAAYMVSTRSSGAEVRGGGNSKMNPLPRLCYSTVYLDGTLIYDMVRMGSDVRPPDLNTFLVSDLAGVEFYPGHASLPIEFQSGPCGTLLLWTREK